MASNAYWPLDRFGFYLNRAHAINMNHLYRDRPPVVGVRARGGVFAADTGPNRVAPSSITRILKFGEDPDEPVENILTPDELMSSELRPTWVEGLTPEQVGYVMRVSNEAREEYAAGFRDINANDEAAKLAAQNKTKVARYVSRTDAANPDAIGEVSDSNNLDGDAPDPGPVQFTEVADLTKTRPVTVVKRHRDHSRGYGLWKGQPLDAKTRHSPEGDI